MIAKRFIYILVITIFSSCSSSQKSQRYNQDMLEKIYESQKNYFNTSIDNKLDFKPIIDFASKGRSNLYKENKFSFEKPAKYILLEGFVNSNGRYTGILLYDNIALAYNNSQTKGWQFFIVNVRNTDSLEHVTGISQTVISRVATWDTVYINQLKRSVGSVVADGFSFIASQIDNTDKKSPTIQTVGFYEFK